MDIRPIRATSARRLCSYLRVKWKIWLTKPLPSHSR